MPFNLSEVDLGLGREHERTVDLVSHAAFHLDELLPMANGLARRGLRPRLLLVEATPGVLKRARSQHRRYQRSLAHLRGLGYGADTTTWSSDKLGAADALVVMNDWGPCRELVDATRAAGGISFGKIEGAQDFDDVDTGKDRNAYRVVDVVFCQGQNDFDGMHGADREIVGNSRLEQLLAGPVRSSASGPAVINSNFSYGQLAEHRSMWLRGTYAACSAAGVDCRVSRHPADLGFIPPWKTTRARIETAILTAPALISRFSSVCFEALAQGIPLAYFNPHGEQAPPFTKPQGAFEVLRSEADLGEFLMAAHDLEAEAVRSQAQPFLGRQIDVGNEPAGERAAAVIANRVLGSSPAVEL